jgi:hypothetical protein
MTWTTTFNDVSVYRPVTMPASYIGSGRKVLIARASSVNAQNVCYVDSTLLSHRSQIGPRMTAFGMYCYIVRPARCPYDIQVATFLQAVGQLKANEFVCVDIEDDLIDPLSVMAFVVRPIEKALNTVSWLYVPERDNTWTIQIASQLPRSVTGSRVVWAPRYSSTPPDWPYDVWQNSNVAPIPGVELVGDESLTMLTPEQLLARTKVASDDLLAWCAQNPSVFRSIVEDVLG